MMSSRFLATGARSLQKCALPGRRFNEKVAVCCFGSIARIGTDDPKMSQAVVHNGIVYISGQIDMTVDDIEGQTRNALAKVDDVLAQAGTSKSKVLTASIWLKNIATDFQPMNTAWNDWIDPLNKPVRVTVEAPMSSEQMLVEIQVTATTDKQ